MVTKAWKVYGLPGHRQRNSFFSSHKNDFSCDGHTRIIAQYNYDLTGTHDFTVVKITRDTEAECIEELNGQISDGIFEACRVGSCEEISLHEVAQMESSLYKVSRLGDTDYFNSFYALKHFFGYPEVDNLSDLLDALASECCGMVFPTITKIEGV